MSYINDVRQGVPAVSQRAVELASQLGLAATYDAHYLALAERLGCALWTADERFRKAVAPTYSIVTWIDQVTPAASAGGASTAI
jgi:predicted nucleic acid-binding protein